MIENDRTAEHPPGRLTIMAFVPRNAPVNMLRRDPHTKALWCAAWSAPSQAFYQEFPKPGFRSSQGGERLKVSSSIADFRYSRRRTTNAYGGPTFPAPTFDVVSPRRPASTITGPNDFLARVGRQRPLTERRQRSRSSFYAQPGIRV